MTDANILSHTRKEDDKMVKEKLSWFWKQFGNLGHRAYYRMNPKVNFMLLILIVRSTIQEYTKMFGSME